MRYALGRRQGISITALAGTMGLSYEAVSKWIKGKTFPNINNLCIMAYVLDERIDDLIVAKCYEGSSLLPLSCL